jgi:TP901 family phage tail tape measure protein
MARELIISVDADTSKAHAAFQTLDADMGKLASGAASAGVDKVTASINTAVTATESWKKTLQQLSGSSGVADQEKAAVAAAAKLGGLQAAAKAAGQEVATLQKQWVDFSSSSQVRGAIEQQLGEAVIGAKALQAELKKTKQEIDTALNPTAGRSFVDSLKDLGPAMTTIGRQLSTFVTVPIVGAAAASVKFATDFEADMVKVHTLSGVTEQDMESMRVAILKLAPAVGIGPDELAKAMLAVTSTGFKGAQAIDILTISAKASAVGMGDATTIARVLTSIIQAYGEKNITAAQAAEIMFKTVKDGNAEASELAGSLGRVVGIAAQAGVSFDQVGTYIATFTRLGVSSAEAVTSLRSVLSELIKPSKGAQDALASVGMTFDQLRQEVKDKGLTASLVDLVGKFKGNEEGLSKLIPNIRALAGVLGTAGAQSTQMVEIQTHLASTTDELGDAFKRTGETAAFKWAQVKAQFEVTAITLGNELLPLLKSLIDNYLIPGTQYLQDWIKYWSELPAPVKTFSEVMVGLVAAGGPVMLGLGALSRAILAIRTLMFGAAAAESGSLVAWLTKLGIGGTTVAAAGFGLGNTQMTRTIGEGPLGVSSELDRQLRGYGSPTAPGAPSKDIGGGLGGLNILGLGSDGNVAGDGQIQNASNAMMTLADKVKALTGEERANILAKAELKESTKAIAKETGIAADVVATFLKQQHAGTAYTKSVQGIVDTIRGHNLKEKETVDALMEVAQDGFVAGTAGADRFRDAVKKLVEAGVDVPPLLLAMNKGLEPLANNGLLAATALEGMSRAEMPVAEGFNRLDEMTSGLNADGTLLAFVLDDVSGKFTNLGPTTYGATEALKKFNAGTAGSSDGLNLLEKDLRHIAQVSSGSFGSMVTDITRVVEEVKLARDSAQQFKNAMADHDKAGMALGAVGMAGSFMSATAPNADAGTGVGLAKGALSGAASGMAIGATIGSVVPVLGTAIGAVVGGIAGAITGFVRNLGASAAEKAGRVVEADFQNQFGGFEGMMTAIGAAYSATGRTAQQAQDDVKRLMDAEKQGGAAAKAMGDQINRAFNEQKQDATDLDAAIQKYGFSIEELGPKMQKQNLDKQAMGLANDWRVLVEAGVPVETVNKKMAKSMNEYLDSARKTGTEVPASMKPVLQSMIDQGLLFDANHKKITDMKGVGVTFADTLTAGFDRIVERLDILLRKLGAIPPALSGAGTTSGGAGGFDTSSDHAPYAAMGGLVLNDGIQRFANGGRVLPFMARGTDTVPAMLTPGEMVLTRGQQAAAGLLGGGRSGGHTFHIDARGAYFDKQGVADLSRKIREGIADGGREQTLWGKAIRSTKRAA